MNLKKGFTLIELLVVIAIIAILAGIAFPVFSRAKDSAYRSSDMSNMNSIRTALQLYRTDQGAYPPALLGYATGYMNIVPSAADIIPADQVVGALYPKRIDSINTLRPSYVRGVPDQLHKQFIPAVWPSVAAGLKGSGAGQPLQRFGPADGTVKRAVRDTSGNCSVLDNYYYTVSGYDAGTVRDGASTRHELRYTLFWTGWTVPADPCNPANNERGSATDDSRQLGYSDPPDTTVVTWNSYFREYENGQLMRVKRDIVLFLGGSARMVDSLSVAERAWQVKP